MSWKRQVLADAKATADSAAENARHLGHSPDEVQSEWWCWFEEELRQKGMEIISVEDRVIAHVGHADPSDSQSPYRPGFPIAVIDGDGPVDEPLPF